MVAILALISFWVAHPNRNFWPSNILPSKINTIRTGYQNLA